MTPLRPAGFQIHRSDCKLGHIGTCYCQTVDAERLFRNSRKGEAPTSPELQVLNGLSLQPPEWWGPRFSWEAAQKILVSLLGGRASIVKASSAEDSSEG